MRMWTFDGRHHIMRIYDYVEAFRDIYLGRQSAGGVLVLLERFGWMNRY